MKRWSAGRKEGNTHLPDWETLTWMTLPPKRFLREGTEKDDSPSAPPQPTWDERGEDLFHKVIDRDRDDGGCGAYKGGEVWEGVKV